MVALLAGLSTMVLSWQRRQRTLAHVIPIVALPIAIPWIALWMYSDGCPGQEQVLTSALNVSGFMVLVITLWSRWWILLAAMGLWLGGVITFALEGAASCESSALLAAFNSLIFLCAKAVSTGSATLQDSHEVDCSSLGVLCLVARKS